MFYLLVRIDRTRRSRWLIFLISYAAYRAVPLKIAEDCFKESSLMIISASIKCAELFQAIDWSRLSLISRTICPRASVSMRASFQKRMFRNAHALRKKLTQQNIAGCLCSCERSGGYNANGFGVSRFRNTLQHTHVLPAAQTLLARHRYGIRV